MNMLQPWPLCPASSSIAGAHAVQYADLPLHTQSPAACKKPTLTSRLGGECFRSRPGSLGPTCLLQLVAHAHIGQAANQAGTFKLLKGLPRPCIRTHVRRVRARARAHHLDVLSTCIALARGAGQHQPGARVAHVQSASIHQQDTRRTRNDLCVEAVEICVLSKIMPGTNKPRVKYNRIDGIDPRRTVEALSIYFT